MTIGGLSQTIKTRDWGLGTGGLSGEHSEPPGHGPELFEPVEIEEHAPDAEPPELCRSGDVGRGAVQHHQIGRAGRHRLDVGRDPVPDARHGERLRRVVAPGRPAHEAVTRADSEEELGERREERHDAPGGRRQRHATAGVVRYREASGGGRALAPRAGRDGQREEAREVGALYPHDKNAHPRRSGDGLAPAPRAQRHHPSREGSTGGANGEVSWLGAGGSPSRVCTPSGAEPLRHALHSGGAAPDSHRLP